MKNLFLAAVAAATLIPAAAQAQEGHDMFSGGYIGVQAGYHDVENGFDGAIGGFRLGYNAPVGESLVAGVEVNGSLGTNDIDSDFGVSAHLGVRVGERALVSGRIGYQEVDFDLPRFARNLGIDDSDGGVLLGVAADVGLADKWSVGGRVETIEFDSLRLLASVDYHF